MLNLRICQICGAGGIDKTMVPDQGKASDELIMTCRRHLNRSHRAAAAASVLVWLAALGVIRPDLAIRFRLNLLIGTSGG